MNANWRSTNTPNVIWIDTHRVTLAEFEDDTAFPIEDMRQGRDCKTPVGRFSMYAGKPNQDDVDSNTRAIFWRSYTATVALVIVCVVILANWPN